MEGFFGDAETGLMLDIIGIPVVIGDLTLKGLMNTPGAIVQRQIAPGTAGVAGVCVVRTSDIPNVKVGDQMTADGVDWVIRRRRPIEDGGLTELHLATPA